MRTKLVFFITAFGLGVGAGSFWDFGWPSGLFFVFLGLIFYLFSVVFHENKASQRLFVFLMIFFFAFGGGFFRYQWKAASDNFPLVNSMVNSRVTLKGVVSEEADERENYTRVTLRAEEINANGAWQKVNAKILIFAARHPSFRYGDYLEAAGVLKEPENLDEVFDWRAYLAKDDIFFEMFYPDIEKLSENQGFWLKSALFGLKEKFLANMGRAIPEPNASFLGGITVGARRSMPQNLQDNFRRTGVIHLVVLSGYNVTIIADAIIRFLNIFAAPGIFSAGLGVFGIFLFALMTGASATVVRASIMAVLVIFARSSGRVYQASFALLAAGFFMILQNPKILRFDASFQLSFLATLALIYLAPRVSGFLAFLPDKFKVREFAAATISTQIFVLPLILYKIGEFSLVSLPANLLILIFIPLTMFLGMAAGIIGGAVSFLGAPFAWAAYVLSFYELWVVDFFANLPFAAFKLTFFPLWLLIFIYGIYAFAIFKLRSGKKE